MRSSLSTSELHENKWVARDRKVGSELRLKLLLQAWEKLLKLNESVEHLTIWNAKKAAAQSQLALAQRQQTMTDQGKEKTYTTASSSTTLIHVNMVTSCVKYNCNMLIIF
jgi:hypothetical protein